MEAGPRRAGAVPVEPAAAAPRTDPGGGCGIGRNLASLGRDAVGVDHNPTSVAEACRRGFTALTVEQWQHSGLRVPGAFDALLLAHVIEHVDELTGDALVQDYLPFLRPGATVMLICPQERGYASDATHVRFVDLDDLAALATRAGLVVAKRFSFPFPRALGRAFVYNEFCLVARTPG